MTLLVLALMPSVAAAQGTGAITGVVTDQATQLPVPAAQEETSLRFAVRDCSSDRSIRWCAQRSCL